MKVAAYQERADSWSKTTQNQCFGQRAAADPKIWKASNILVKGKRGEKFLSFKDTPNELHRNLTRAQSSIAMQIRSEHIGFNPYLIQRKVPGVDTPCYPCGYPSQNVEHMIMACPQWSKWRGDWLRRAKKRSFQGMMNSHEDIARITQWILNQEWLEQFRLVRDVEAAITDTELSQRKGEGWHRRESLIHVQIVPVHFLLVNIKS